MKNPKVGERVRIYNSTGVLHGTIFSYGVDLIRVELILKDGIKSYSNYYPQQCRRLKKKAPLREYWLQVDGEDTIVGVLDRKPNFDFTAIHVREVRKKC